MTVRMRSLTACTLGALFVVSVADAADPGGRIPDKLSPRSARLWVEGEERFRAILHLAAPETAALPLAARGIAQPRARLEAVANTTRSALSRLAARIGPADLAVRHVYRLQATVAVDLSRRGLEEATSLPEVVWVEEAELWHAHTAEGLAIIGADVLHDSGFDGAGCAVAVVDTGIDPYHPSLGRGPIPNGVVLYGLDTADEDPDPTDCNGHGTAVASVAAGRPHSWDSLTRFAGGVAPGAGILAYKASPDALCGTFDSRDVVAAIEDAILRRDQFNVVAVNLSLGGEPTTGPCDGDSRLQSYAAAVDSATQAGIAVVASSGNGASATMLDAPACLSQTISVASVYDSQVSSVAYCSNGQADPCTPHVCQDLNPPPLSVPCYANTSPFLDLVAPSEVLTAAAAGGELAEFGGTSGAAPYVTGAVALLHQAMPGLDPTRARLLVELTGQPVSAPERGLTRSLVDLPNALAAPGVAVSEGEVTFPDDSAEPAVSSVWLDDDGFVAKVEVAVKILHGRPQQLVVSLVAPGGTRVRLHDHQPGSLADGSAGGLQGANGVWATYPRDAETVDSLEAFLDRPARGTWTLEALDTGPTPVPGAQPRIVGWGIQVATRLTPRPPELSASSFVVPVAARSPGTNGAFWKSDVRVLNPSPTIQALIRLYLVPQGADGTESFQLASVTVPPRTVLDLPDVVGELLGTDRVQGNLLFVTDASRVLATSRTYNTGGDAGTYGQLVPTARATGAIGQGDPPLVLLQLASSAAFRTNLGFSETAGSRATVSVSLYDGATATHLGTAADVTVEPFSNTQVNDLFSAVGAASSDNAYAVVEVTGDSGRVVTYASVVDNQTGDAIFVPGAHPPQTAELMVPIVARSPGANQTSWISDLRLYNPGLVPLLLRLEHRPQQGRGGSPVNATVVVEPAQVLAVDDVLGGLFHLESGAGSLRVLSVAGVVELMATSRTYNRTAHGTYGQLVPAVLSGFGRAGGATLIDLDRNAAFRTNLGLCEIGGGTVELRYVLKSATGSTLGVGSAVLGPYEVRQVNDLHATLGVEEGSNTRVDLLMDAGDGAFTAYASVVDNLSGDAVFIPAAGL